MLVVFRLGMFIPVPNINSDSDKVSGLQCFWFFKYLWRRRTSEFLHTFLWGSCLILRRPLLFSFCKWMLYLNSLSGLNKVKWKKKLAQVTRYGTVILGFIQAIGLSFGFNAKFPGLVENPDTLDLLAYRSDTYCGTSFLMWLGEQITAYGVGNGISVIIFAGIVARIPNAVNQIYAQRFENASNVFLQS